MFIPVSNVYWGADPEAFFVKNGQVIGSEKVLPMVGSNIVVLDGVQFELNPTAYHTVRVFGTNVATCFQTLRTILAKHPDVSICYDTLVEVSRKELDSLNPKSRELGCQPSKNIYGFRPIKANPKTYRKRTAAGHLHFGLSYTNLMQTRTLEDLRHRTVPYFDIFLGNTLVMLDGDPKAAERRENYGRAGEYRLPSHGVEYRVPSNFWLRNYTLLSLAMGLGNIALSLVNESLTNPKIEDESEVDISQFIKAINTNDFELAKKNFNFIRPFLVKHLPDQINSPFALTPSNIDKFLVFADGVREHGLKAYFPDDPLNSWCKGGFEEFGTFIQRI